MEQIKRLKITQGRETYPCPWCSGVITRDYYTQLDGRMVFVEKCDSCDYKHHSNEQL